MKGSYFRSYASFRNRKKKKNKMTKVKKLVVSGFRGIRSRLELDFQKAGQPQSTILYGANGTGKSSFTDAWEWLITGKIGHLAREGAEDGAYPHIHAKPETTYVDVEFSDPAIGRAGLLFNNKRVTMPTPRGNLDAVRKFVTHPCHLRYADLTRFVMYRKSERYDALAALMGFVPQMEYQKTLRRVQTLLENDLQRQQQLFGDTEERFKTHFGLITADQDSALRLLSDTCILHE
ncbi:MAG: AAA family ATPase, partial [Candidatus Binatia bacterium]